MKTSRSDASLRLIGFSGLATVVIVLILYKLNRKCVETKSYIT